MRAAGRTIVQLRGASDYVHLYALGDVHLGNVGCAEARFQQAIDAVAADPKARWIGMGDYADCISANDPRRFDPSSIAPWVSVKDMGRLGKTLLSRFRDMVQPIRAKCIGLLYGNHEDKYMTQHEQQDLHSWLCADLDVPNLTYSAFIKFQLMRAKTSRTTWTIYAHHGSGWAETRGGKLNRLLAFMRTFEADLVLVGHTHDSIDTYHARVGVTQDGLAAVERVQWGLLTGAFLRTYPPDEPTYGEKKGYAPVRLRAPRITLRPMNSHAGEKFRGESRNIVLPEPEIAWV